MKKAIYLFIFFIISVVANAERIDSLINVVDNPELTISEKLSIYKDICTYYVDNDIWKQTVYAKKGLELAEKSQDKVMISWFNAIIGDAYLTQGKYDIALKYLEKTLVAAQESGDEAQEAFAYANMGNLYNYQSNNIMALDYYLKGLSLAENSDEWYYMMILSNIGGIYRSLYSEDRAKYYIEKASVLAEEMDDDNGRMYSYYELGAIYLVEHDLDKALEYGLKVIELANKLSDKSYLYYGMQALVFVYIELKEYDKALGYTDKCMQIAEEFESPRLLAGAWALYSNIYREQKRYKESEETALKAWEADSTNLDMNPVILGNLLYSNIFLGDKEKAHTNFWKLNGIIKQYMNNTTHEILLNMDVRYEAGKKEMKIESLKKEKQLFIWLGIAVLLVLLLALGLLLIRHRLNIQKRRVAEQQREIAEQQRELVEQQVKQLEQEKQLVATQAVLDGETAERSRLARDLHDGLGGLLSVVKLNLKDVKNYSIMDGADTNRFNKALEVLDQSIGELRRVAHHMMPESLMRNGLKVSLEDFCRAIPGAHFQYFGNDKRLDERLEIVLYHSTYELVNNALKYANAKNINIQLMIDEDIISLTVQDDGDGFDPGSVKNGTGLTNIRTRISAYNGKMDIYSSPGNGSEISIEIEFYNKNEKK